MPDATIARHGRLVLVVGPSGAGKDTLLRLAADALQDAPDVVFARRIVTRATGEHEDHDTIAADAFERAMTAGEFALAWRAHGLGYALPPRVVGDLHEGRTVIANVSRAVVDEARRRFSRVNVVLVTAPVETLVQRVAARGREADARARVMRDAPDLAVLSPDLVIENVGEPSAGAAALAAFVAADLRPRP